MSPEQLGVLPDSMQAMASLTCPTPALQMRCGRGNTCRTGVGAGALDDLAPSATARTRSRSLPLRMEIVPVSPMASRVQVDAPLGIIRQKPRAPFSNAR